MNRYCQGERERSRCGLQVFDVKKKKFLKISRPKNKTLVYAPMPQVHPVDFNIGCGTKYYRQNHLYVKHFRRLYAHVDTGGRIIAACNLNAINNSPWSTRRAHKKGHILRASTKSVCAVYNMGTSAFVNLLKIILLRHKAYRWQRSFCVRYLNKILRLFFFFFSMDRKKMYNTNY